jgi:uncharacterized membrane protein
MDVSGTRHRSIETLGMESATVDTATDPLASASPEAEGSRRSGLVILGLVVLGLLGALAGVVGYVRQSEPLDDKSELPAEGDEGEPVVVYADVSPLDPSLEVEPLSEPRSEPESLPELVAVNDAADDRVAEKAEKAPVVDERAEGVTAFDEPPLNVPVLDEAAPKEVHVESGESRIDFEPAALFADPLAMRDRRGSLRR